jgi:sugar/nucleoside kinase (ribokinase family)
MGPSALVIKRGEHGVLAFLGDEMFSAPGFPLEKVADPTGAGDSFAGGFFGYLAQHDEHGPAALRRAVVAGSVMASFCVEEFSLDGLVDLDADRIAHRYRAFQLLTDFGDF